MLNASNSIIKKLQNKFCLQFYSDVKEINFLTDNFRLYLANISPNTFPNTAPAISTATGRSQAFQLSIVLMLLIRHKVNPKKNKE